MIAVDTNVLVYARRSTAPQHGVALSLLHGLATGSTPWALPLPCIVEFLRVVTHSVFRPAVPLADAWQNIQSLLASPSIQVLTPTDRHLVLLRELMEESGASGNLAYDAQIATLCLEHGVREILTADKDFRRFPSIKATDPFARGA